MKCKIILSTEQLKEGEIAYCKTDHKFYYNDGGVVSEIASKLTPKEEKLQKLAYQMIDIINNK
jgi:hypothetical protein